MPTLLKIKYIKTYRFLLYLPYKSVGVDGQNKTHSCASSYKNLSYSGLHESQSVLSLWWQVLQVEWQFMQAHKSSSPYSPLFKIIK